MSFILRSLNEKGFAVKGKVHCSATPDGKQSNNDGKYIIPFPFRSLPSKDKSKSNIRRYNPSENSSNIGQIQFG